MLTFSPARYSSPSPSSASGLTNPHFYNADRSPPFFTSFLDARSRIPWLMPHREHSFLSPFQRPPPTFVSTLVSHLLQVSTSLTRLLLQKLDVHPCFRTSLRDNSYASTTFHWLVIPRFLPLMSSSPVCESRFSGYHIYQYGALPTCR